MVLGLIVWVSKVQVWRVRSRSSKQDLGSATHPQNVPKALKQTDFEVELGISKEPGHIPFQPVNPCLPRLPKTVYRAFIIRIGFGGPLCYS